MKRLMIPALAIALALLTACGALDAPPSAPEEAAPSAAPEKITAQAAHDRMQSGDALIILDVRTPAEYAEAHIEGAILLPNEDIGDVRPAALPILDTEILIYCRSGNRSAQAAAKLAALGYTKLYDFGGIKDWTYKTVAGPWETEEKDGTLSSFATYALNGMPVDEEVFAGAKLTMVSTWSADCAPCLEAMPALGQLSADYADRGVQVIGLVADISQESDGSYPQSQIDTARTLASEAGADYLHLLPSADLRQARPVETDSIPETFFVDRSGHVVGETYEGPRSASAWGEIIDSLLLDIEE